MCWAWWVSLEFQLLLRPVLELSSRNPYQQIFSTELLLPGSQVLQHTVLEVSEKKALQARKKMDFCMKTGIEDSSNLIARLNFIGFELKVFRCKKTPHSLSRNVKRPFCPVLMIPSRGLPSVLPSEGFLIGIQEAYAGQSKHLWPSRLIPNNL